MRDLSIIRFRAVDPPRGVAFLDLAHVGHSGTRQLGVNRMLRNTLIAVAAVSVLALGVSTYAQPGDDRDERAPRRGPARVGPPSPEEVFSRIDANNDGSVSQEEFIAHHDQRAERGGPPRLGPPGEGQAARQGPRNRRGAQQGDRRGGRRAMGRGQGDDERRGRGRGFGRRGGDRDRSTQQGPPCPHCQGSGVMGPESRGPGIGPGRDGGERDDRRARRPRRGRRERDRPAAESEQGAESAAAERDSDV